MSKQKLYHEFDSAWICEHCGASADKTEVCSICPVRAGQSLGVLPMSKHDERLLEKEIAHLQQERDNLIGTLKKHQEGAKLEAQHLQGQVARMTQDVIALQQENAELKARNDGLRKALDFANEQLHEALPMRKQEE